MDGDDSVSIFSYVENFLTEERTKLKDDRKSIDLVYNVLQEKQQNCTHDDFHKLKENIFTCAANSDLCHSENTSPQSTCELIQETIAKHCVKNLPFFQDSRQGEIDRLALLFQNSPYFFHTPVSSKKWRRLKDVSNFAICSNSKNHYSIENKENQYLICKDARISNFCSLQCMASDKSKENGCEKTMVRFGEYSPLHLAFSSTRDSSRGLGEYGERRKLFLEKKRKDYLQYLKKKKNNADREPKFKVDDTKENLSDLNDSIDEHRRIYVPEAFYTRLQQESCRKELDKQIEAKEKLWKELENLEKSQCEKYECDSKHQRQCITKHNEDDYNTRGYKLNNKDGEPKSRNCVPNHSHRTEIHRLNDSDPTSNFVLKNNKCSDSENEKRKKETYHEELSKQIKEKRKLEEEWKINGNIDFQISQNTKIDDRTPLMHQDAESYAINDIEKYRKMQQHIYDQKLIKQLAEKLNCEQLNERNDKCTNSRTPPYLWNPLMKQSAESTAIGDIEAFRKRQHELYKKDLEKQIAEKRELEERQKAEAVEKERQLEDKIRKEVARLREEYEKEEAGRTQDAAQKVQVQKRVQENLQRLKKQTDKKCLTEVKFLSKSLKQSNITIGHTAFQKHVKNVSFAPQKFQKNNHNRGKCSSEAVIIEAPYTLAAIDVSNVNTIKKCSISKQHDVIKSFPPVSLESVETIFKKLRENSRPAQVPPAVSMSRRATQQYFKSNTFSDLSRIRKILEYQTNRNY